MPCPPSEDLPNPGIKARSPALQVDSLPAEPPGKPKVKVRAQMVKNPPARPRSSLGREDLLEKEMTTHSNILAWRIPWPEEPRGLLSTGLQRLPRCLVAMPVVTMGARLSQLMDEGSHLPSPAVPPARRLGWSALPSLTRPRCLLPLPLLTPPAFWLEEEV